MQESIIVFLLFLLGLFVLRLPLRRMRSLRVESRIGNAALHFDPLPLASPSTGPREVPRDPKRSAPQLPAAHQTGKPRPQPCARPTASPARRAVLRKRKRRKR